ncbi:MAG: hypothetical protein K6U12_02370 [Armatimonadetes bacterium]|nr:hypothetical protein [Armatimonadota bacterium]CUU37748.1 hypothetical protein DCOP10_120216 [Armatimonadetes bacterium DC]
MRKWLIGCGVLFGLVFLLCAGGLVWLLTPPKIEVPPRQYPSQNAYKVYRAIGEEMHARFETDTRFKQIENVISRGEPVSKEDRDYYLQQITPYLKRYAPLTQQPSKVIMLYTPDYPFPELGQFRRLARAEAYLMKQELRQRRYREAVARAQRLNRLADQMREGGTLIHFLVGAAINAIALRPIREELPRIQERAALEALLNLAKEYEKRRVPIWRCMETEMHWHLSIYRDLAEGHMRLSQLSSSFSETDGGTLFTRALIKAALPEYKRVMEQAIEDLKRPYRERPIDTDAIEKQIRHPLNAILLPVFSRPSEIELSELATLRLVGCVAAIRLYKQRTGKYPASLEALQLGEMVIDPFTGKPFVYKADPQRGFLLYSVSENRVDDGGATPYFGSAEKHGDLSPTAVLLPKHLQGVPRERRPLAPPVWLR